MLYIFKIECLIPIRYFDIINNAYFLMIILLIFLGDKSKYTTCFICALYTLRISLYAIIGYSKNSFILYLNLFLKLTYF